jgi:hypothetical protein
MSVSLLGEITGEQASDGGDSLTKVAPFDKLAGQVRAAEPFLDGFLGRSRRSLISIRSIS